MAVLPPFLLLFDISALTAGKTRDWQEFSKLGECLVPKAVLDEIQFLQDRAPEPAIAATAREFARFFADSGWRVTTSIVSHPALQPTEGHALSHKARLALAVAQAAYGLSRNRPEGLVVLVANDQGLLQRLRMLNVPNLCGMPLAALMQWMRTQRRPPVVSHQLQLMRLPLQGAAQRSPVGAAQPAVVSQPVRSITPTRPAPAEPQRSSVRRSSNLAAQLAQILSSLTMVLIIAIAGLGAWRLVHPKSFRQFWQQLPLPTQIKTVEFDAILPGAIAAPVDRATKSVEAPLVAQLADPSAASVPRSVVSAVRQDLSKRVGVAPEKLRVVEATRKTWPNSCFGLPRPDEQCALALVEGWRVVLSDGSKRWIYRTDQRGRFYRMEPTKRKAEPKTEASKLQPNRISNSDLPAVLPANAVFREIASGGIAGLSYQITLYQDGRLVREPLGAKEPSSQSQVLHVDAQQVQEFQTVLQQKMEPFDRLNYPAAVGADYRTLTLSSRTSTVRYADLVQEQLPESLRAVVQSWNDLVKAANSGSVKLLHPPINELTKASRSC